MKTALSPLSLLKPDSLDHALEILRDDPRTPIAGATDVYVQLNFGVHPATRFLDIWGLDELRTISVRDDVLTLGALVTYTDLIDSREVHDRLPMIVEAARQVGGPQIQNRGTVGGNIANGSPAGDSLPVLAAADAVVVLRSLAAERRVPLTAFYTGYRASVMQSDELIVAVEVPRVPGVQFFRKVGTRAAQAISKIVVAATRDGTAVRIAVGSVAPTVVRLEATERAFAAGAPLDQAMQILRGEVRPIDDVRSTAEYRLRVTENVVRRFWMETSG
jgi:xanthine dehydrogenase small subunit